MGGKGADMNNLGNEQSVRQKAKGAELLFSLVYQLKHSALVSPGEMG
jgi:hypothetical protein